ncbi:DUF418 domain-containing protein [Robiginitalea sp. SC105]|uniref:DUF418 domain-containing protein n=1 Tax=Robiginitalea sp. SC105 TaxID=2762332 RepID=UPI00163B4969|nr:DUF418 domain-containing protein [Robiginitalea sp. SC105]MBC2839855.1 DUF418 domain-containing protein [Robiginitalea sp. SC105]
MNHLAGTPTDPGRRIESVDIVRGFALFGVLLVNMYNFGATFPVWTAPQDELALALTRIFFEYKSFRLFSFLFGFGIALQIAKSYKTGGVNYAFYLRRLFALFLIGMLNCLLYDGDVLMLYAEFGIVLLLFRKVPGYFLLLGWLIFNLHFPIQRALNYTHEPSPEKLPAEAIIQRSQEQIRELRQSHPYSVGSISEVMAFNAKSIPPNPVDNTSFFGMCLLGIYAARKRYFHDATIHRPIIKGVFIWGVILGLIGMGIIQYLRHSVGYSPEAIGGGTWLQNLVGDLCTVFGSTALSMGYAAGLVLLSQSARFKRYLTPLANVGRYALTTYILQTIMFSTLFYGYGFDQGLRIGPFIVSMYALIFFAIQVVACNLWARYFKFGPLEWIWRSISYWKRITILKANPEH